MSAVNLTPALRTVFMIRDKLSGLYSPGGCDADTAKWAEHGKQWPSIGALKNHLRQFWKRDWSSGSAKEICRVPETWEVIEVELVPRERTVKSARAMLAPLK